MRSFLAQEHNARLTMLQVIENGAVDTEARRREINISRREPPMMRDFEDWCKREFCVTLGSAVEKILEEAREGQAGLIVMGTKASGNVAGHAPLTIGYNGVTKATCPVLTFRG
jgi:nucleotide-binding universal stress UspA family protein